MFKVYYTQEGGKPFEMVFSGTTHTIQPPDKFWKKVKVDYKIGDIRNRYGVIVKELWARDRHAYREEWVPDDEMNASGQRPRNWLYMSEDMWAVATTQKYLEFRPYLDRDIDMEARREDELAKHRKEIEEEIARERYRGEVEKRKIREEVDAELSKASVHAKMEKVRAAKHTQQEKAG